MFKKEPGDKDVTQCASFCSLMTEQKNGSHKNLEYLRAPHLVLKWIKCMLKYEYTDYS